MKKHKKASLPVDGPPSAFKKDHTLPKGERPLNRHERRKLVKLAKKHMQ